MGENSIQEEGEIICTGEIPHTCKSTHNVRISAEVVAWLLMSSAISLTFSTPSTACDKQQR